MNKLLLTVTFTSMASAGAVFAGDCQGMLNDRQLAALLKDAPATGGDAGGLFHGTRMWGAIVNRKG